MSISILNSSNKRNISFCLKKLLSEELVILVITDVIDFKNIENFWQRFKGVKTSPRAKFKTAPQYGINIVDFSKQKDDYFRLLDNEKKKLDFLLNSKLDPIKLISELFRENKINKLKEHGNEYAQYMIRFSKSIKTHQDNYLKTNPDWKVSRFGDSILSWNLFLNMPSGGALVVKHNDQFYRYTPSINDLVIFKPSLAHTVEDTIDSTEYSSKSFRQYRIAVTGLFGIKEENIHLFN